MITPEQREVIIKEIGPNYGVKIDLYARKNKITKDRGQGFYNKEVFYQVLSGREWDKIEDIILDCFSYYKKRNKRKEARKNKMLQNKQ